MEWLILIRLSEYTIQLRNQGYNSVNEILQISVEDLEDIGLVKLGHQKRFLLAKKKAKDILSSRRSIQVNANYLKTPQANLHYKVKYLDYLGYSGDLSKHCLKSTRKFDTEYLAE